MSREGHGPAILGMGLDPGAGPSDAVNVRYPELLRGRLGMVSRGISAAPELAMRFQEGQRS